MIKDRQNHRAVVIKAKIASSEDAGEGSGQRVKKD